MVLLRGLCIFVILLRLQSGSSPKYATKDFQRCLDPTGEALTTSHDISHCLYGLDILVQFCRGGNSQYPDVKSKQTWRRPGVNSYAIPARAFHMIILLCISRDVQLNPGPNYRSPCGPWEDELSDRWDSLNYSCKYGTT